VTSERPQADATDESARDESRPSEAMTGLVGRTKTFVARTTSSLEERRDRSRTIDTAFHVVERNQALPAPVLIGALASRLVIYVIPLFVLMVFAIGLYSDLASTSASEAARTAGMAGLFATVAEDTTNASDGWRFAAVIGTSFAVLWAADALARLLRRVFALIWRVPLSRPRKRWLLPFAVIGISIVGMASSTAGIRFQGWPLTVQAAEVLLEIGLVVLLWLAISRVMPHDPEATQWWNLVPGSVLVAVGIVALKVAMVVYFAPRSVALSERYGSVATAVVLLSWAYWIGFMVVASTELNAAMFRSRRRREPAT
jgi:uncharacterized BrkB/YihY/UPF0761 family membrane protein